MFTYMWTKYNYSCGKSSRNMGISQMELDERIGVARGLVSKWEVGIRKPSGFLFCVWADALGCEMWLKEKS